MRLIFSQLRPTFPQLRPTFPKQRPTFPLLRPTFPQLRPTFPKQRSTFSKCVPPSLSCVPLLSAATHCPTFSRLSSKCNKFYLSHCPPTPPPTSLYSKHKSIPTDAHKKWTISHKCRKFFLLHCPPTPPPPTSLYPKHKNIPTDTYKKWRKKNNKTLNERKEGPRCVLLFLKENDSAALSLLNKACNSF